MRGIAEELCRLRDAADSGALAALCGRRGLDLMVLHGSAVGLFDGIRDGSAGGGAGRPMPRDIDLAVRVEHGGGEPDPIQLLQDVYELIGSERVDLMMLHRAGPVARQRALTRGRKLYEAASGRFAEAQIAASMEYYDTEPLRRLSRSLLGAR